MQPKKPFETEVLTLTGEIAFSRTERLNAFSLLRRDQKKFDRVKRVGNTMDWIKLVLEESLICRIQYCLMSAEANDCVS